MAPLRKVCDIVSFETRSVNEVKNGWKIENTMILKNTMKERPTPLPSSPVLMTEKTESKQEQENGNQTRTKNKTNDTQCKDGLNYAVRYILFLVVCCIIVRIIFNHKWPMQHTLHILQESQILIC